MKKRVWAFLMVLILCLSMGTVSAQASTYGRVSRVSRSDGVWLFPLASKYWNKFSDWAGCPGNGKCGFCGKTHPGWGDRAHTSQAPLGHNGIDIAAGAGQKVLASASGKVVYCNTNAKNARGIFMILEHKISGTGYSYYSYYQHLSQIKAGKGKTVRAGDVIALSGKTGQCSGAHLHFGIVMAKSGTSIGSRLTQIEKKGWLTAKGYAEKRILNNPSVSNTLPAGYKAVQAPLAAHSGSVTYTFDKSKVTVGKSAEKPASTLSIGSGKYSPGTLKKGAYYSINGVISSNYKLTMVSVGICYSNGGATSYTRSVNPNAKSYNIKKLDSYMKFNKLASGSYLFKVIAMDSSGTLKTLVNKKFTVLAPSRLSIGSGRYAPGTLKKGSYYSIRGVVSSNYKLSAVTVGIYSSSGKATSYVRTAKPNVTAYNISRLDYYMKFNKLARGQYYFRVTAKDASGTSKTLVNNRFTIR